MKNKKGKTMHIQVHPVDLSELRARQQSARKLWQMFRDHDRGLISLEEVALAAEEEILHEAVYKTSSSVVGMRFKCVECDWGNDRVLVHLACDGNGHEEHKEVVPLIAFFEFYTPVLIN